MWEEVRFTVIFVTHSIEEALLIGSRILVLSPHPGRVKAELNAQHLGFDDLGTPAFEQLQRRIHDLLFADRIETELRRPVMADVPHRRCCRRSGRNASSASMRWARSATSRGRSRPIERLTNITLVRRLHRAGRAGGRLGSLCALLLRTRCCSRASATPSRRSGRRRRTAR